MSETFLFAAASRAHDAAPPTEPSSTDYTTLTDDVWLVILSQLTAHELARAGETGSALWNRLIRARGASAPLPPAIRASAERRALDLDHAWLQPHTCWRLMPNQTPRPQLTARAAERALARGIDIAGTTPPVNSWHCPIQWRGGSWLAVLHAAELTAQAWLVPVETHGPPIVEWFSNPKQRYKITAALSSQMSQRSPLVTLTASAFRNAADAPAAFGVHMHVHVQPPRREPVPDRTTFTHRVTVTTDENRHQLTLLTADGDPSTWHILTTWTEPRTEQINT